MFGTGWGGEAVIAWTVQSCRVLRSPKWEKRREKKKHYIIERAAAHCARYPRFRPPRSPALCISHEGSRSPASSSFLSHTSICLAAQAPEARQLPGDVRAKGRDVVVSGCSTLSSAAGAHALSQPGLITQNQPTLPPFARTHTPLTTTPPPFYFYPILCVVYWDAKIGRGVGKERKKSHTRARLANPPPPPGGDNVGGAEAADQPRASPGTQTHPGPRSFLRPWSRALGSRANERAGDEMRTGGVSSLSG